MKKYFSVKNYRRILPALRTKCNKQGFATVANKSEIAAGFPLSLTGQF